ncbi:MULTISPECIES: CoA-disulfide reductase [unclassified Clostridioides]|uniref:CoA-disulfide reductase n=1 Tax=unclassified Clostridioides TaxID=2635829 RepID=UPI001D124227|nr:CoA-disulfide reductase [Clostridioides sp. ZZV14-6150]MCC0668610.1 CoA-disulfide reductase [Clostridioides sp. ZZV14-6153]MCC0722050.1 CoA-disulfide reductase [Clostridioides sp. ZZV14-6104]MCC0725925.1 CoA-disulfide reductase [Clostridioides sp. ZZV14-6045]MCC0731997.1 CoA-disulfide reductase [Clostridioides sp. ZZV14-6048]MCC0743749.1 CoA-disulfide reductase [Clostridioides sp. ZZV14-6044]MCC0750765.1 CoA-disulfide reductase [Clostridioides sp. ZZV13-5731]
MNKKIIIVGGVAGGASTAARLRRLDEKAQIIMFEKGEYISFANCGLPYYIGGSINEREKLIVQTVETMSSKFNLDIRNLSEVIKIDKENKSVSVKNHKTGETYEESYDVLVLSPGAKPIKPPISGINECKNLFTLRNIPDTDKIKTYVDNNKPKHAVVIGGGFIGLEMAENLHDKGIKLTLVEASEQVMAPLDIEMVSVIHDHLISKDIELILKDGVKFFSENGNKVILSSGKEIKTDMIILSIGVKPETTIAKEAGLKLNERGAIIVDNYMKTSDENIYALGDAVEITDFINKKPTMIPLAWPANRQGRLVADNICGRDITYQGTLGSSVAKVFDYTVATTGNNEKTLKRIGLDYKAIHIHPGSHAGYYPGAFPISLKMTFDPKTGKIFGAQGVGIEGVEKRIDVLATAIKGGLTVFDLPDIETCYAPPYNSAKDPVNMLGYYASNIIEDLVEIVQWNEVDNIIADSGVIIDVREEFELATGKIPNSMHIPLGQLRDRLNEIPKNKKLYATCQIGLRGYVACRILEQHGLKCINIDGGVKTYLAVKRAEESINKQNKSEKINTNSEDFDMDMENIDIAKIDANVTLDACGLQCPGPIRRVFEEINKMQEGQILEVRASDPGFSRDIQSWCEKTRNTLMKAEFDKTKKAFVAYIRKGLTVLNVNPSCNINQSDKNGATLVVFSGDLDKAIASFIIATGAASMGKEVTMFFTFWGLNILKRKDKPNVSKDTMEKMFDIMLPSHTGKLPLSQMNMAGMGPKMINQIMKKHNVDDLDTLIKNAMDMGVKVVACTMSMDLMGIKSEEFIDGVDLGGVASYLGATEDAGLNLFV